MSLKRTMSPALLAMFLLMTSSVAEDGIVHRQSELTYVLPGENEGFEIRMTDRIPRVLTFSDNCTCGTPNLPPNTIFSHCWGKFPASVMQCECLLCRLSVDVKCGCQNQRWYPVDQSECDPALGSKNCGICTTLPEYAVHHESRYELRYRGEKLKLQGYSGEKLRLRCKSSCREVNAICSHSTGFWRYRSDEKPCSEYESRYEGTREEDGLMFELGYKKEFSFSCPVGKHLNSTEQVKCLAGNLTAKFPTCKAVEVNSSFVFEAPVTSTLTSEVSTLTSEVTTLTSEVTDSGDILHSKQPIAQLGTLDYILVAVIITFIVILIGLWSWIIKDKRREAREKRLLLVKQATTKQYVL